MNQLLEAVLYHSDFKDLLNRYAKGNQALVTGVSGTQKSLLMAALYLSKPQKTLIISYNNNQAYRLATDLESWLGPEAVAYFPGNDLFPHEEAYEPEVTAERIDTLGRIMRQESLMIVTSWEALQRRLIAPERLLQFTISLKTGQEYPLADLLEKMVILGYERVDLVQEMGQFSSRGDIVDVFPLDREDPIRIEFFGDEVDSLRSFKTETQSSTANLTEVTLIPAREGLWLPEEFVAAKIKIEAQLAAQVHRLEEQGRVTEAEALASKINEALERLSDGHQIPGADQFLPWIVPHLVSLLEYLPEGRVILDEPLRGRDGFSTLEQETIEIISNYLEKGVILPKESENFIGLGDLEREIMAKEPWYYSLLAKNPRGYEVDKVLTVPWREPPPFQNQREHLAEELEQLLKNGYTVVLAVSNKDKAVRLKEVLREQGVAATVVAPGEAAELIRRTVQIQIIDLESGLEWPGNKLMLLSEIEIYGRKKKRYPSRFRQEGSKINSFTDLKAGDYVVHLNHGIGCFVGLETLEIAGGHRDYLRIEYAGEDRLFVPTDQLNLLQKYVGHENVPPKVNKLGGSDWQKVKARVKASLQDMADALLDLYAQREVTPGYAFGSDTVWQQEFEDDFYYEETPDQLRACVEIKQDMERPKPMDRLLCGDVGYGKTEVAMRAAFKAVMDGKQVGVLVPTTILAQQHYLTFSERMTGYPINIRVISRFQSFREQTAAIKGLLTGEVDLIIGTHRLLSEDIHFKNLGLLIIDEEQRFGVTHKEQIKKMRQNVDVLTLSATPIPRTLHMSLAGIRDMSLIETAPQGRFPIRTHVLEYNDEVIRGAIQRELDRNGQVYFVYNRVESIERMASFLQELVPKARIIIGHGQMDEDHLERVMLDFYDNQADILLCTTIIETGLDIPNVNTLIVYDADRFGLAQLYQLRGRVGRSNRIAHAYFCYQKNKVLSERAEKRLMAIREFTELGSGFKIAMRDLEIRGAGNLLGPEQHGQIAAVGFELYCRLLEEAVRERRGQTTPELPEPSIDFPIDAYIPGEYISDHRQKVEIYKKIAGIRSEEESAVVLDQLLDRFGEPPQAVLNLLDVAKIKLVAKEVGLSSITQERQEIVGKLHHGLTLDYEKILLVLEKYRSHFRYYPGRAPVLKWKVLNKPEPLLKMVLDTLNILVS